LYTSHTSSRSSNSGGNCGQELSTDGHSVASTVEPGCGRTHERTQ
jgi:hypothetical protein